MIFAFNDKQFNEGMRKLGLTPSDTVGFLQAIDKEIVDRLVKAIWVDKNGNVEFEFNYKDPSDLESMQ